MPKRGASSMTMRRSRSSSWPERSTCSGALGGSAERVRRHVVHLAVGQHDHRRRCGPAARRQSAVVSGSNSCVPSVASRRFGGARLDRPDLDVAELREALLHLRLGRRRRGIATVERLAGALVDHQRHHRRQRLAVLVEQHRVGQRQDQRHGRRQAQPRAAHAAEQAGDDQQRRDDRQHGDHRHRHQR